MKSRLESILILFSIFLFPSISKSQMVNIETMRMQTDSVRFAGNANFHFAYQENNSISLLVLKSALAMQVKSKSLKDIFMLIGNLDLSKSAGQDFSNAAFGHLRYNRKISKWLRWEVFTQIQYNKLLSVGLRTLAGTGPRFKLFGTENIIGYVGTLYMYEYEETTETVAEIHHHHRMSDYFTMSIGIPKIKGEMVTTTYFQPRLDKWNDYRIMQQTSLAFNITKKLKVTTGFSYLYDAFPPAGVNKKALSFDQGFRIDF